MFYVLFFAIDLIPYMSYARRSKALGKGGHVFKSCIFRTLKGQTSTARDFNILGWIVTASVSHNIEKPPTTSRTYR